MCGFGIGDCRTVECRQHFYGAVYSVSVYSVKRLRLLITGKRHVSVNVVYDMKPRRYAEDNRTEFNRTQL